MSHVPNTPPLWWKVTPGARVHQAEHDFFRKHVLPLLYDYDDRDVDQLVNHVREARDEHYQSPYPGILLQVAWLTGYRGFRLLRESSGRLDEIFRIEHQSK